MPMAFVQVASKIPTRRQHTTAGVSFDTTETTIAEITATPGKYLYDLEWFLDFTGPSGQPATFRVYYQNAADTWVELHSRGGYTSGVDLSGGANAALQIGTGGTMTNPSAATVSAFSTASAKAYKVTAQSDSGSQTTGAGIFCLEGDV